MYQNHKILMYKEHSLLPENELAVFLYDVMMILFKASDILCISPLYECKYKKNSNKFEWNTENLKDYLKKHCSKVNNQIVGYSLSFFSDLNEDNSSNITISISCTDKMLSVLDLQLSYNICSSFYKDKQICNELKNTFVNLVGKFNPFYACIKNDKNISGKLLDEITLFPGQVHWLNFFSNRKYSNLCVNLRSSMYIKEFNDGKILYFGEKPIDVLDEARITEQKQCLRFEFE